MDSLIYIGSRFRDRGLCDWANVYEGARLFAVLLEQCGSPLLAVGAYRTKGARCVELDTAHAVIRTWHQIGGES